MQEITISIERFQQLVRAEQDANFLKALIAVKVNKFSVFTYEDLEILNAVYCGGQQ